MDWRAQYTQAVTLEEEEKVSKPTPVVMQQEKKRPMGKTLAFIDLLLNYEGGKWWIDHHAKYSIQHKSYDKETPSTSDEDNKRIQLLKNRLAVISTQLLIQLPELSGSVATVSDISKVRVLQLQLVCRALLYGALTKTKIKDRKILKNEIRNLTDRVALLLDAANPPSLAAEDADERSPFQVFLKHELAPRLQVLLPNLMRYLLRVYELDDEDITASDKRDTMETKLPMIHPVSNPLQLSPKTVIPDKKNIIAALLQERPIKNARSSASTLLKEVQLPRQLQSHFQQSKNISTNHDNSTCKGSKARRRNCASKNDTARCHDSLEASNKMTHTPRMGGVEGTAKTTIASSDQKDCKTNKPLFDVAKTTGTIGPAKRSIDSAKSDQTNFANRQSAVISSMISSGKTRLPEIRSKKKTSLPNAKPTSSIIMRTPDRPKRMAARNKRRILVDASPPLRKPSGIGLLQPKSLRRSVKLPALFRK
ncbi:hypothetical protein CCR75_004331 [Bremia lactucae]|uniref:Uncharacterized protein n=1 Tax=Bremia lactucae TaxID=4779 RepID=A0A976FKZ3_BRELC|nr:hypothetical protein CCR75_004331 [Bremia lactucae]